MIFCSMAAEGRRRLELSLAGSEVQAAVESWRQCLGTDACYACPGVVGCCVREKKDLLKGHLTECSCPV